MARTDTYVGEEYGGVGNAQAVVLIVGFLGLAGALVSAHLAPATGYELDIYAATPLPFWAGVAVAYASFLVACLAGDRMRTTGVALLLGGATTTAVAGLPLIRGYHYYGHSDPMTHLGWARAIEAGALDTLDFVYPGTHSLAVVVHQTTGLAVPFSMMLVVLSLVATFVAFVPLTVYVLTADRTAAAVAGFSGFLLLPINNIATGLPYFPFLLATFYFSVLLYLLVKHVTVPAVEGASLLDRSRVLPTSLVVPVASTTVLFFHPQATLDVVALFGAVVVAQVAIRQVRPAHPLADTRVMAGQFLFLFALFYLWSSQQGAAERTAQQIYTSLEAAVIGSGEEGQFAQTAAARQESARRAGISVVELFGKLFLVSTIYGLLSLVAGAVAWRGRFSVRNYDASNVVALLYVGGVAVAVVSFLHAFGGVSSYLYRHVGFVALLATVLGAVGAAELGKRAFDRLDGSVARTAGRGVAACLAVLVLVPSLLVVFPSPYMYNPGAHVTEGTVDGYETALERKPNVTWNDERAVWYGGIRTGPNRYKEARRLQYPLEYRVVYSGPIPNESLADLPAYYRTYEEPVVRRDHYVPVSRYAYEREVGAYRELRYREAGFRAMRDQPGVHRTQDNGDLSVYYVDVDLYDDG